MRVNIDQSLCQGHGRCEQINDLLFAVNDDGIGVVLTPEVTDEVAADVRLAIANCPEKAISTVG